MCVDYRRSVSSSSAMKRTEAPASGESRRQLLLPVTCRHCATLRLYLFPLSGPEKPELAHGALPNPDLPP